VNAGSWLSIEPHTPVPPQSTDPAIIPHSLGSFPGVRDQRDRRRGREGSGRNRREKENRWREGGREGVRGDFLHMKYPQGQARRKTMDPTTNRNKFEICSKTSVAESCSNKSYLTFVDRDCPSQLQGKLSSVDIVPPSTPHAPPLGSYALFKTRGKPDYWVPWGYKSGQRYLEACLLLHALSKGYLSVEDSLVSVPC
jgi:hypothetical protein